MESVEREAGNGRERANGGAREALGRGQRKNKLVDAGFEPAKLIAFDLQSNPFDQSRLFKVGKSTYII